MPLARNLSAPHRLPATSTAPPSTPPACAAPDVRRGVVDAVLATRHAGTRHLRLHYELVGPDDGPVVLVAGGISADRHVAANGLDAAAGWAQGLLEPGRTLDPARRRVLAFDYVGADGAIDAPIDTADQADAVAAVLEGRITNATAVAAVLALQALRASGADEDSLRPADAPFMERPGRD